MNIMPRMLPGLLSALLLLGGGLVPATAALPDRVAGEPLPSLAPMLKRVTPAVVNISSRHHVRARDPFLDDPFFRQFFGLPSQPRERVEQALGSGVVVDADKGLILTNHHVIKDADDISVALPDGRKFKATLVGTDPGTDVAVLRIDADGLTALPVADSSRLEVGDFVVAVGEPFGFGQTVTSGIVSALRRSGLGNTYQDFIQTDASINPGNSGGALVNLSGELVGINSMIYSPSGASAGIGFAIPSNLAVDVMHQLIEHGRVRRGSLGVDTQDINERLASALGLEAARGALVTHVADASAAARAGLREGDVILALGDERIADSRQLANAEGLLPVDRRISVRIWRHDGEHTLPVQLEAEEVARAAGAEIDARLGGASLQDLEKHARDGGAWGVEVAAVAPGSAAAANGLRAGDRIIGAGRARVASIRQLRRLLSPPPEGLVLTVARDGRAWYLRMR